ncbi:diacylglycerol kinase family protein [Ideonella sp. A 288]|uniref:diacylglycerol/lipid kinase family protein n=1 Tax=Ideonella sp. A 288 TaxID=1962181 RepID=UPI001303BB93|nr:diacylglycerol kinase family protein [Ideonella sp. A 288]
MLLNPQAAGGRAARLLPRVQAHLSRHAPGATLQCFHSADEALAWLRSRPRGSRVVLAGGDGTVHRMLPALLVRGHQLGLLPCGTGNDTARAFGVHRLAAEDALDLALRAEARAIDIGEVVCGAACTPFVSSLAAGFDAAVAQRALQAPGWLRGLPRYLAATFAELAALRRFGVEAWVDGQPRPLGDTLFASTLNTRSYGSGMPAAPAARIDDGRLDLLVAGRFGTVGALAMMPLLLAGLHLRHPRVRALPFTTLRLRADPPLPLAADGEPLPDATELTVRVRPAALMAVRRPA